MFKWKSYSAKTRKEVKGFLYAGLVMILLVDFLSVFSGDYPWQVYQMTEFLSAAGAPDTGNASLMFVKGFFKSSFITALYLLIATDGMFFILVAFGLCKKLYASVSR